MGGFVERHFVRRGFARNGWCLQSVTHEEMQELLVEQLTLGCVAATSQGAKPVSGVLRIAVRASNDQYVLCEER